MAWMPVAEAAATLGVSERTIWRRIKSDTIPSRSEQGRTLVSLESRGDPAGDPVWQLSNVAAAQLSMRKLDADTVSEVLAIASDYRKSFDSEIARVRRTSRWMGVAVAGLLVALFAGGWRYLDLLGKTQLEHQSAMAELRDTFQTTAADLKAQSAKASGLADARKEEVESLHQQEGNTQSQLVAAEASRGALQTTLDQRLGAIQKSLSAEQNVVKQRDQQVAQLNQTVQDLQIQLVGRDRARDAILRQAGRVTAAIRRSAAREAGTAVGLRLYLERQQREILALRQQVAYAQGDGESPRQPTPTHFTASKRQAQLSTTQGVTREALWNAVSRQNNTMATSAATSANTGLPTWRDTLLTWYKHWIGMRPATVEPETQNGLASASRSE